MNIADTVNGLFEILGGFFVFLSIRTLIRDKELKGYNPATIGFFTAWGFWNLYFYPAVGATLSFLGGIVICLTNIVFIFLIFYYKWRNNNDKIRGIDVSTENRRGGHAVLY